MPKNSPAGWQLARPSQCQSPDQHQTRISPTKHHINHRAHGSGDNQEHKGILPEATVWRLLEELDLDGKDNSNDAQQLNYDRLAAQAWNSVTPTTLSNCFRKAGFVRPDIPVLSLSQVDIPKITAPIGYYQQYFDQYQPEEENENIIQVEDDASIRASI